MSLKFKDFFKYNRSEKQSILVLLGILIGLILFLNFYDFIIESQDQDLSKLHEAKNYFDSLATIKNDEKTQYSDYSKNKTEELKIKTELFQFDPNELNLEGWQRLGLTEKQSKTILNYRNKGGKFRIKKDLKKMYSISDEKYTELNPYILLPDSFAKNYKKVKSKVFKNWTPPIVNINTADSAMFTKLRGIGPTYASRIIKYRNALTGFHSKSQLSEIYGISDSLLETFNDQLIIDTLSIRNMDVNKMDAKQLKQNPYINWNVANSIVNFREQHGLYKSNEEIKKSVLIDDSLFQKIEPYLLIVK